MLHSVDLARTHEILARYRPIAPKPALPPQSGGGPCSAADGSYTSMSPEKLAAAALRHLPPRASRSRKRGRVGCNCFVPQKRPKTTFVPVLPSPNVSLPFPANKTAQLRPVLPLSPPRFPADVEKTIGSCADLLTLSLGPFSSSSSGAKEMRLDLNAEPDISPAGKDLTLAPMAHVIVPQPVRPIGSSISVGCISEDKQAVVPAPPTSKKAEEVEEEMESEVLPAVVSDSSNRVRLTNAAYKEMLGQPECSWLDAMAGGSFRAGSKRRINGEVMLDLSGLAMPTSANAFSCRVTIEWACNGRKTFVKAPCDVIKLFCDSKDYLFAWKFHTQCLDSDCKT